jgi:cell filamentation protein
MYEAQQDTYCYVGTTVLKNKAGLRDQDALDRFETAMTFARAEEPLPIGRLSVTHYCRIHHHLFQDVYRWAGKYRTVRLSKAGSMFCYPEHIDREMTRLFGALKDDGFLRELEPDQFASGAARFLSELNAIHPFREGNGRMQSTFLVLVAHQAGHSLDLDRLDPNTMLAAMITSFNTDEESLTTVIRQLIA